MISIGLTAAWRSRPDAVMRRLSDIIDGKQGGPFPVTDARGNISHYQIDIANDWTATIQGRGLYVAYRHGADLEEKIRPWLQHVFSLNFDDIEGTHDENKMRSLFPDL